MANKIIFNLISSNRQSNHWTRYIKKVDENNKTINIGTLYLDYNNLEKNQKVYDKLEHNEIIQCKEFISVYNKTRRCLDSANNSNFKSQTIYWNESFANMLYEVAEYAENNGVNFMPKDALFENLLHKLETLNKQIDLSDIFDKYNFKPTYKGALFHIDNTERQALIDHFLNINSDKTLLINSFNDYLHDVYKVEKTFTYEMLEELTQNRKDRAIRSYVMSACIDILLSYGVNLCDKHSPAMIFYYWYSVRLKKYNAYEAINQFMNEFEIDEKQLELVYPALTDLLSKPIMPNHVLIQN